MESIFPANTVFATFKNISSSLLRPLWCMATYGWRDTATEWETGCEPGGLLESWAQLPIIGPLKQESPKGTQWDRERERGKLGPKEKIQRLAWEMFRARLPGCKARRTQRKHSGGALAQKALATQNPAPTAQRWTPRPRDTLRLLKGTQRSCAWPRTRATDPSQEHLSAPAGPNGPQLTLPRSGSL